MSTFPDEKSSVRSDARTAPAPKVRLVRAAPLIETGVVTAKNKGPTVAKATQRRRPLRKIEPLPKVESLADIDGKVIRAYVRHWMQSKEGRSFLIAAASQLVLLLILALTVASHTLPAVAIYLTATANADDDKLTFEPTPLTVAETPSEILESSEAAPLPAAQASATIDIQAPPPSFVPAATAVAMVGSVRGMGIDGLLKAAPEGRGGGGGEGQGTGSGGEGKGPAPKPKSKVMFGGSGYPAKNVAFVIDNSASMFADKKFDHIRLALLNSVGQMPPANKFFVCFFSNQVQPMFSPQVEKEMLLATDVNKAKLRDWVAGMTVDNNGGPPHQAVEHVMELKPDVVFLLYDGITRSESTFDRVINSGKSAKIPVNTIYIPDKRADRKTESLRGAVEMERVAKETGGVFFVVDF